MVKIRLRRLGAKKAPFYRVVVRQSSAEKSRSPLIRRIGHERVAALHRQKPCG